MILIFDWGGTYIKYGLWDKKLTETNKFPTPENYDELKSKMLEIYSKYNKLGIEGIAISSPGGFDKFDGQIYGNSALPYIHGFDIFNDLKKTFELPLTIENDANCAALAENKEGAGKGYENLIFLILGTSVGGSLILNNKLYKGTHLFAGEFGLMKDEINGKSNIFSMTASAVKMSNLFNEKFKTELTGEEIFNLSDEGDLNAIEYVNWLYDNIAKCIYNIQVCLDTEAIIIGGGISKRKQIKDEIEKRVKKLLTEEHMVSIMPSIKLCEFDNDANLIGAVVNYMEENKNEKDNISM